MACEQWEQKLDLYLDGELAPAEETVLRAHLQGCVRCAIDALDRVQLKKSVHMAGKRFDPSAQARAKIVKTIARTAPIKSAREGGWWGWRIVFASAALVLIAFLLLNSYLGRERTARQRVYSELADLHVSTLASSTPVDVVSSDRHTVKPWFQGKIPFTFNLPELQSSEFTLMGGRVTYLEQTPGAHLIFQVRKHEISVFIFPERALETSSLPTGTVNALSFNTESWTHNGLRYFVVGDTSSDDIKALSKLLRDAA